jgi:hypothetical protein
LAKGFVLAKGFAKKTPGKLKKISDCTSLQIVQVYRLYKCIDRTLVQTVQVY